MSNVLILLHFVYYYYIAQKKLQMFGLARGLREELLARGLREDLLARGLREFVCARLARGFACARLARGSACARLSRDLNIVKSHTLKSEHSEINHLLFYFFLGPR